MFTHGIRAFTVLLCVCIASLCFLQAPHADYRVSLLTSKDGLSQASNFYMKEDSQGYMWISSYDGINVYNGKTILHFTEKYFYKDCQPIKFITGIEEDSEGNMWLGSTNGLYKYDRRKNIFTLIKVATSLQLNTSDENAIPFAIIGNEVWVFNGYNIFYAINIKNSSSRLIQQIPVSYSSTPAHPKFDSKGNLWCINNTGLLKIDTSLHTVSNYFSSHPGNKAGKAVLLSGFDINKFYDIIALDTEAGIVLFDIKKQREIRVKIPGDFNKTNDDRCLMTDGRRFLFSSRSCPLLEINLDNLAANSLISNEKLINIKFDKYGTAGMYKDRWNRIWLNKNGEYLAIVDFDETFFKKVTAENNPGDLKAGTTVSITAVNKNEVWIVEGGCISILDKIGGKIFNGYTPADLNEFKIKSFYEVYFDRLLNRVWIGADQQILYFDIATGQFKKFGVDFTTAVTEKNNTVSNFIRLANGNLIMATLKGVYEIDVAFNTTKEIPALEDLPVYFISELPGYRMAVGIAGQPMRIYEYLPGKRPVLIKTLTELNNFPMFAAGDSISGTTWIGSRKGVYQLKKDFSIERLYTSGEGLANDYIYGLMLDNRQNPWFSTNKGIISIDVIHKKVMNFPLAYNLQDLEFNNRTFAKDDEGYLYFGGVKGVNYFKPPFKENDSIKPVLVLEEINLNNKPLLNEVNPAYINRVNYSYGAYNLALKVAAVHLKNGSDLKIIYRFKGDGKEWNSISNGDYIHFYNLAAGKYELELGYINMQGDQVNTGKTITIIVAAPWYATWWFYLLLSLILASLVYQLYRYRIRQFQKNILLRMQLSKDLHDDVGASLSSIHIFSSVAEKVIDTDPARAKEVIQQINTNTRQVMDNMNDIVWALKIDTAKEITFKNRIKNFGYELLASKQINCDYAIDEKATARIIKPDARKNIQLIIKESINNISKYSEATQVTIKIYLKDNFIEIVITDNGKGFEENRIKKGNGLKNIRSRALDLRGTCVIDSQPGTGTTISCSIPLTSISD